MELPGHPGLSRRCLRIAICLCQLAAVAAQPQVQTAFRPPTSAELPKLAPHPRLLATDEDFKRLKATLATDAQAQQYFQQLQQFGETIKAYPTNHTNMYKPNHSWQHLWYRVVACGMLFRLTGDKTWAAAGIHETNATGNLPNWGGPTYLEVAGLTYAAAIGFDWFYDELTSAERAHISGFLVEQGINLAQYDKYKGDFGGYTNRNIVANGCYLLGALAIWEEQPKLASQLWDLTTVAMQNGLLMYSDSGWWEGFVYWGYATEHTISIGLTLNATFGTDFGFASIAGLAGSGDFAIRMFSNATRHNYAFADSGPLNNEYAAIMFWHNRVFPSARMAYTARLATRAFYVGQPPRYPGELPDPPGCPEGGGKDCPASGRYPAWSLLFWDGRGSEADLLALPAVHAYHNISNVMIRSNWSSSALPEKAATLLSYKGGATYWSHNHRDLGSFSFESRGVRWAQDLGLENYGAGGADNALNYRISTLGHNTLTFGGASQPAGEQ